MNKKRIFFISASITIILGSLFVSVYSFYRESVIRRNDECSRLATTCPLEIVPRTLWEIFSDSPGSVAPGYVPVRFGPTDRVMTCDQSATATPCSVITSFQQATSSLEQIAPPKPFEFGDLDQVYMDKDFGFSFRYPKEIVLIDRQDVCPYLLSHPDAKSAVFVIQSPRCSSFSDFSSFDDYKKDYVTYGIEETKLEYKLLVNKDIKTQSGTQGLYQEFSLIVGGQSSNPPEHYGQKRYIFKLPKNGFLIFLGPNDVLDSTYYSPLETAITESITFP